MPPKKSQRHVGAAEQKKKETKRRNGLVRAMAQALSISPAIYRDLDNNLVIRTILSRMNESLLSNETLLTETIIRKMDNLVKANTNEIGYLTHRVYAAYHKKL